jgi:hypothetical protein
LFGALGSNHRTDPLALLPLGPAAACTASLSYRVTDTTGPCVSLSVCGFHRQAGPDAPLFTLRACLSAAWGPFSRPVCFPGSLSLDRFSRLGGRQGRFLAPPGGHKCTGPVHHTASCAASTTVHTNLAGSAGRRKPRGEGEWIRRPCLASPRTRAGGLQNVMGRFESDVIPVFASSPTYSPSSTTGAAPIAHRCRDLHCNTVARVTRNLHASIIGKKSLRLFAMSLGLFSAGPCGWAPKSRCGSRRHVLRRWAEHRRAAGLGAASPSPLMPTTSIRLCIFLFSVCTDWSSGWGDGG